MKVLKEALPKNNFLADKTKIKNKWKNKIHNLFAFVVCIANNTCIFDI